MGAQHVMYFCVNHAIQNGAHKLLEHMVIVCKHDIVVCTTTDIFSFHFLTLTFYKNNQVNFALCNALYLYWKVHCIPRFLVQFHDSNNK